MQDWKGVIKYHCDINTLWEDIVIFVLFFVMFCLFFSFTLAEYLEPSTNLKNSEIH